MAANKLSLKLVMDKNSKRVIFAEATKEFVDFLFNFLTLPFGNITEILKEEGMDGCLPSLYKSIETLSDAYFLPDQHKDLVLKPVVAIPGPKVPLLLPIVETFKSHGEYHPSWGCGSCGRYCVTQLKLYYKTRLCPSCTASVPSDGFSSSTSSSDKDGYVKGTITYMVMDDLEVKPMFTVSFVTLLNQFNVEDVGAIEEKVVELGMDEGVQLLKASFQSKTVLTDVFLLAAVETEDSIKNEGA